MRWLYHVLDAGAWVEDAYRPSSLAREGFVHCSYRDEVADSARRYFGADARLEVLLIDPRALDCEVRVAATPRGPMPHVHGPIPRAAIVRVLTIDQLSDAPDEIG